LSTNPLDSLLSRSSLAPIDHTQPFDQPQSCVSQFLITMLIGSKQEQRSIYCDIWALHMCGPRSVCSVLNIT